MRHHCHAIVVAHTHWDREWWATFEQFRMRLVQLVDRVIELLEGNPEFRYFTLDGQTVVLDDYLAIRPENDAKLRALVQSGRLVVGPWYVLPDEFLVSAESLVRNLMLGRQVAHKFGPAMAVGYVPDPFGHIAQLPQVLAGFGIDSFIFSRGLGDEGETLGSEFLWRAPDGTKVLAIHQIGWDDRITGYLNAASLGYASPWAPRHGGPDLELAVSQLGELTRVLRRYARTPYVLINNGCDHMEAQPELPGFLRRANEKHGDAVYAQGTFCHCVEQVRAVGADLREWDGELRGSRYAPILSGVLSSRMHLKQENRSTEALLQSWAEPFAAFDWLEGGEYPAAFLWHAWRQLLQNQPHDSICGCSIDAVHDEMLPRFAMAQQVAERCLTQAMERLARDADRSFLPDGAVPLAVFNPLPWPGREVVELSFDTPNDWPAETELVAVDTAGHRWPCHITDRRRHQPLQSSPPREVEALKVLFSADLPAFGYRIFGLLPVAPTAIAGASSSIIDNESYRVSVRPDGVLEVIHKPTGHVVSGAFALVDQADAGDEYTFAPLADEAPITTRGLRPAVRVIKDAQYSALELSFDWQLPAGLAVDRKTRSTQRVSCPVSMRLELHSGVDRLDAQIAVDNAALDHRLRLLLPTGIIADEVVAAGHFGTLIRPLSVVGGDCWAEQPTPTTHHDGFVAVCDGRACVALLSGDSPEYEPIPSADGTVALALTLLRCVGWLSRDDIASRPGHAGPGLPTPGAQCLGRYRFKLALHIATGDWQTAKVHHAALAQQLPPRALLLGTPDGAGTAAPAERSFLSLHGKSLVLSAVKRSEDGRWLVVRVFNAAPVASAGMLSFYRRIKRCVALRLDETELSALHPKGNRLEFTAPAHKVLTFGFQFR